MSAQNQPQNEQAAENNNGQQPAVQQQNTPAVQQQTYAERFTNAIEHEFSSNAGAIALTTFQRKLCQNYFIKIDMILKESERKRMAKKEEYREQLPYEWKNINMQKLAVDVIAYSAIGLDPTQPNHLNPIPYKNNHSQKYDITFIIGYRGTEIKARKYGFEVPDDVVVELVWSNDKFKAIKKDINNKIEGYVFEIVDDFNRGEIVGGFYYHIYFDKPEKNKLRVFTRAEIEKRKPDYASAEFWGGEKDKWENGKKVGKEQVEGWFDEMAFKTIYKAAYNTITIDSEKIDANYMQVIKREVEQRDSTVMREIANNANRTEIGFTEDIQSEVIPNEGPATRVVKQEVAEEVGANNQTQTLGPGF